MESNESGENNQQQRILAQLKMVEKEFYHMQLVTHIIVFVIALGSLINAIVIYGSTFLESDFFYVLVSCVYGAQSIPLDTYCKSSDKQIKKKLTHVYTLLASSLNPAIVNEKKKIEDIFRDDYSLSAYGQLLLVRVYIGYIVLCARPPFCNWAIVFGFVIDHVTVLRVLLSFNHSTWKLTSGKGVEICQTIRSIARTVARVTTSARSQA